MLFFDQLNELTLGEYDVTQIEARKFDLLRQRALQQAALGQAFEQPVVEGALIFKFQRTDRMRDVFHRIFDGVGEGVHWIHAPAVAGVVMLGVTDAINGRVAQIDVGGGHVDLGAQNMRAVRKLSRLHAAEEQHVLGRAALAIGRVLARFGERATGGANFVRALTIDVGVARLDQIFGAGDHPVEIVGRVIEIVLVAAIPGKTEPANGVDD